MNLPDAMRPMNDGGTDQPTLNDLTAEFFDRRSRGEDPTVDEYTDRFPQLADDLRSRLAGDDDQTRLLRGPQTPNLDGTHISNIEAGARGDSTPARLGDFRIIREIGRGGMGVVYEAEQESLDRRVALKVLPAQFLNDDDQRRRFEREARSAAALHHTNIVPVYGVGDEADVLYFAMQFIDGMGLDAVLKELRSAAIEDEHTATQTTDEDASGAKTEQPRSADEMREAAGDVSAVTRFLLHKSPEATVAIRSQPDRQPSTVVGLPGPNAAGGSSAASFELQTSDDPTDHLHAADLHVSNATGATPSSRKRTAKETYSITAKGASYWRNVARIGVQTAEALDYAHLQGILHRDVKPSNLLLDRRGTVWVTDFGLAKAVEGDAENLTHTGDILGTIRYMAPERFQGESDARSDVYSLGLTLYELLALRPAFDATDQHELIRQVTQSSPPRLRSLNHNIPRDLETIVMKAAAHEPAQRYQTAGALAEDLERFLADRSIRARRANIAARFGRWCRRNPLVAGLTAALLLVLLSGLAGVTWKWREAEQQKRLLAQAEADLRVQRDEAVAARDEARRERSTARKHADEADHQRDAADANFKHAMSAVDDFFVTVSQSRLLNVPGLQPLRRELLQSALEYYQKFIRDREEDPALKTELAKAWMQVGEINSQIGQTETALNAIEEAHGIQRELVAINPSDAKRLDELARLLDRKAGLLRDLGRPDASRAAYLEAIVVVERLIELEPGEPDRLHRLAGVTSNFSRLLREREELDAALEYTRRAIAIEEELVLARPESANFRAYLATMHNGLGILLIEMKREEEALAALSRAIELHDELIEQNPRDENRKAGLAGAHVNLGNAQRRLGRLNDAEESYRKGIEVQEPLVSENPAVHKYRDFLATAYGNLGLVLKSRKQYEQAIEAYRRAIASREHLVAVDPGVVSYRESLGLLHYNVGRLHDAKGAHAEAVDAFKRSVTFRRSLADEIPGDHNTRGRLAAGLMSLGTSARRCNQRELASKLYEEARGILRSLVAEDAESAGRMEQLAYCLNLSGLLEMERDRDAAAEAFFTDSIAVRTKLLEAHAELTMSRVELGGTECNLGHLCRSRREFSKAIDWYDRSVMRLDSTLEDDNTKGTANARARQYLRSALKGRAACSENEEHPAESLADWNRIVELTRGKNNYDRIQRARARAVAGEVDAAIQEVDELSNDGLPEIARYYVAGVLALAAGAVDADQSIDAEKRKARSDSLAERSLKILVEIHASGFFKNPARAKKLVDDADFASLATREEFRRLLAEIRGGSEI